MGRAHPAHTYPLDLLRWKHGRMAQSVGQTLIDCEFAADPGFAAATGRNWTVP